jgi:rRNA-processing protein FCF1
MRILIDTNIFIYRENDQVLSDDLQNLTKLLSDIRATVLVHPLSHQEIEDIQDKRLRGVMLSKIRAYSLLESPPVPKASDDFFTSIEELPDSPISVDNQLLFAMFRNAVDYLVTEDRGIHRKAMRLGITDRVLLIQEALQDLRKYLVRDRVFISPALELVPVHNLDINDPIFDTLKEDYSAGFIPWFEKVCREGRKCFVNYREDGRLGALLIYKPEDQAIDSIPPLPKKYRLKLATFIVSQVGQRIGELFIRLAVDIAIENRIDEIYLTHFIRKEDRLVDLITEYGFVHVAMKARNEAVFTKSLICEQEECSRLTPKQLSKQYYPSFYDGPSVKKFIVPIRPEYHDRLFTDFRRRRISLTEYFGEFYTEGNSIKKVYITHSNIRKIRPGDLILFYRSDDTKGITSIGVVESFHPNLENVNEISLLVTRRTVYSQTEIETMRKPLSVILFTHHFHFPRPVLNREMLDNGILEGPPQVISEVTDEKYNWILEKSGIDRRFAFH